MQLREPPENRRIIINQKQGRRQERQHPDQPRAPADYGGIAEFQRYPQIKPWEQQSAYSDNVSEPVQMNRQRPQPVLNVRGDKQ